MTMKRLILIIVLSFCAAGVTACTSEQLQRQAAEARKYYAPTTQAVTDLETEIATLPPGDPVRVKAEAKLAQAQKYLAILDAIIRAGESGKFDSPELRGAVSAIPYGGLVIGVGGILVAWFQRVQAQKNAKALDQVVAGFDAVMPEKTEQAKLTMSAVQDESTRKLVAVSKAKRAPAPVVVTKPTTA
jgi:hypothetical protein